MNLVEIAIIISCSIKFLHAQSKSSANGVTIGPIEICHQKSYNASCGPNEVLRIEQASYGRMRLGKCVERDLGFLGCEANVKAIVASSCSGRQHCQVSTLDTRLFATKPCPSDTTPYIEITYSCLKVASITPGQCHMRQPLELSIAQKAEGDSFAGGYISTLLSELQGAGLSRCPWRITALPGQRINVTLESYIDQSVVASPSTGVLPPSGCYAIATVQEHNTVERTLKSCIPLGRTSSITSQGNDVTVTLPSLHELHDLGAFLLRFDAVGCPNIPGNEATLVTISDRESARVECTHTGEVRFLTCSGITWIGDAGNCTSRIAASNPSGAGKFFQHKEFPYGLFIAVAIGVALGVFLGGLLLTMVALHNKRKRHDAQDTRQACEREAIYYDTKTRQHYCELQRLHGGLMDTPNCPGNHDVNTRPGDFTTTPYDEEKSHGGEYFLKPDPDLFCTVDKAYDQKHQVRRTNYVGVPQI